MEKRLLNFLKDLAEAPGPSGFEQAPQEVYRKFITPYVDDVKTDVHGNVIASKKGKGKKRIALIAHIDEVGLMVKYIDDQGFVKFSTIGVIDLALLPGLRVNIYHGNEIVRGVVGAKPIHVYKGWERDKAITLDELWIDIGAKDKKDAQKMVSVGDFITYNPGIEHLPNHLILTKAADNRAGVFAIAAVLSNLENEAIEANVFAVSTVQEELFYRGAITSTFGIDPHIGLVVDITLATDHPTIDKNFYGEIQLNKGVVITLGANINPRVFEILKSAAELAKLDYQVEAIAGTTVTDANAVQISRSGVATGVVSIPHRYAHTPSEIISVKDLESTVELLTQFCRMIDDNTNLIP